MGPVRTPTAVVLVAALALVTACEKDKADPDADLRAARGRLAVLAQATANGSYDATYRFVQRPSGTAGTIRILQSPPQYRIDVVSTNSATYYALTTGIVSCSRKGKKKTCFLVARPGEDPPALFDPGVQRLFRDAVEDLAQHPTDYTVRTVPNPLVSSGPGPSSGSPSASASPSPSASPGLPTGECFAVNRAASPSADRNGFEDGTYCLDERGVATYIDVASGTLTLTRLLDPPDARAFKPITKVQQLPDLTPTPTPSKRK
jgi:hypothetical protein